MLYNLIQMGLEMCCNKYSSEFLVKVFSHSNMRPKFLQPTYCLVQVFPTWFAWVWILGGHQAADNYLCNITAISLEERDPTVKMFSPSPRW